MSTTIEDVHWEMAMEQLHQEAVMDRATREQCIYLFVEGASEAMAIPILLNERIDFRSDVRIADYNGRGNLFSALRLLKMTLSHTRPIVLTHDNDPESLQSVDECRRAGLVDDLVYCQPLPCAPVVTYSNGHHGGSFEEAFPVQLFLDSLFCANVLPDAVINMKDDFLRSFDPAAPWLAQVKKFAADRGFRELATRKVALAELMAGRCDKPPESFMRVAELLHEVRKKHPVIHPDDVELPES